MRVLPGIAVVASLIALAALLPIAGGMPSLASGGQPLSDGVWFFANLGGPLLLLAGGLKKLLPRVSSPGFVIAYVVSVAVLGIARFAAVGFNRLVFGWALMALCLAGMLFMLRRSWIWVIVGALWSALLLGLWSVGGVLSYFAAAAPQFPFFLPLQVLACVMTLAVFFAYLLRRSSLDQT
jgi:hypothetical protein